MEILDHLKSRKLRRGHLGSIEQDEFVEIIVSLLQALERKLVVKGYLQRPSDSPYGTWVLTEKIMKK
jgi:hypothetical protein